MAAVSACNRARGRPAGDRELPDIIISMVMWVCLCSG